MTRELFSDRHERDALEQQWLDLTRRLMPQAAKPRSWPIRHDHCFQRVLLDNACGGIWYARIHGRPAYKNAPDSVLRTAIRLGVGALEATIDLSALNHNSLQWRGKARREKAGSAEAKAP